MKDSDLPKGKFIVNGDGRGFVDEDMVNQRAREIAVINGRSPEQVTETDLGQARDELTGKNIGPMTTEESEATTMAGAWDPVPGTAGHHVASRTPDDEQTFAEELVQEGMEEAEHDQMLDHTREAEKGDQV